MGTWPAGLRATRYGIGGLLGGGDVWNVLMRYVLLERDGGACGVSPLSMSLSSMRTPSISESDRCG